MPRALKIALAAFVVAVVTPVSAAGVMLTSYLLLPLPANLPERNGREAAQISRVYDAAGNEIGIFKQFETSIPATREDIPEIVKHAVVAAEDRNFYAHSGVDLRGTLRALWADIRSRELAQGGSTITQQLVKITTDNGSERTIVRKLREAVLATQLDRSMDKEDILFEYVTNIYLGEGAYGFPAAAQTFFRKSVRDLTVSEAALLAGAIPAPSAYSARDHPDVAEQRRLLVLKAMLDEGYLDQATYDAAAAEVVWLAVNGPPPGPATVVQPAETQQSSQPYFTDYVRRWLEVHLPGGADQIYRDGLRIETTLDPDLQSAAEKRVRDFLDRREPDLRTSLVSVEPPTGYVRAFVSGRDFAVDQVNYALGGASVAGIVEDPQGQPQRAVIRGGGSGRQPGSAFKPFVLAAALDSGITPDAVFSGAPHDVREACGAHNTKPLENYGGARYGSMDLRQATWRSVNTVYTRLILEVGVEKAMDVARTMGLAGVRPYDAAEHCASVALGAESVSPLDMASAYGVFAARGLRAEPTPVLRVTDREGNVLLDNTEPTSTRVIREAVADNVTAILRGVLESGTASGRGLDRPAAGKTGTTQDNVDAWFVGYTPTLSTAVWMGFENKTVRRTMDGVTGGRFPASIWQAYMREALAGVPVTEFNEPAPIEAIPDAARRQQRGGFAPAPKMRPAAPGGTTLEEELAPPVALPPPTTTTTTTTSLPTSTTSTTLRSTRPLPTAPSTTAPDG